MAAAGEGDARRAVIKGSKQMGARFLRERERDVAHGSPDGEIRSEECISVLL